MKIKTKLLLGFGLLLLLIAALSIISTRHINKIKFDTENILTDNYNSVNYAKTMLLNLNPNSLQRNENFLAQLHLQKQNITEAGEKEATQEIEKNYPIWVSTQNATLKDQIEKQLLTIIQLNMDAIQRKSELAKNSANDGVIKIAITASMCFLIAFVILFNLPSHIANPIQELTKSIQQIANENYTERVHFTNHSEYGQLALSFNVMAEKLQSYSNSNLAKLMMEKQRIETLINFMPDPVIGFDEELNILFINQNAAQILNIAPEKISEIQTQELMENNDLFKNLCEYIHAPAPNDEALQILNQGKEFYYKKEVVHLKFKPVAETQEKTIGYVLLLKNITEYKELDQAKTNFIATVSHEFKTPIAAIHLSTELLKNPKIGTLNPEQLDLVQSIDEDTLRLLKITSELLNMTQLESGKIQLSLAKTDPEKLIQYAIMATKSAADQKELQIKVHTEPHIPAIAIDAEKTTWVLTNLLSNAIRYSYPASEIQVQISTIGENVRIAVKDFGPGISPEYQSKIFDRYFRVPGSQKEGTGLGLSISKEFIEAQKGSIGLISELGAGCEFWFSFKA